MNCDILKSKLIFCEWNAFYFIEIAFKGFTFDEIKQCIVFFGTPGTVYIYIYSYFKKGCLSKSKNVKHKTMSAQCMMGMQGPFCIN